MQKFFLKFTGFALLSLVFIISSCTNDDDPIINPPLGPEIRFVSEAGFLSTDAQILPGDTFKVKVTGIQGDSPLKDLTIREDGTVLPSGSQQDDRVISIIDTNTGDDVTNNPLLVVGASTGGTTWEITIIGHKVLEEHAYEFTLNDSDGNSDAISLNINVFGELSIELLEETDFISDTTTILGAGNFNVKVSTSRGVAQLASIAVYAEGNLIDPAELTFGGIVFDANPLTISGANTDGFEETLSINSHDKGTQSYTIEIKDADGNAETVTFDLTVMIEYVAVIINNADGPNLGGLDLDTGDTVPAADADAEIRDKGIDIATVPVEDNWIQEIEAVNGAEIRIPDMAQMENFSYDAATSRAIIIAAYDSGLDLADGDQVEVGDLFVVKRGDDYFLMSASQVVVKNASVDNTDYYEFDVKQVLGK